MKIGKIVILIAALCCGRAYAQVVETDRAVLSDIISVPDLNNKARTGIATHIGDICEVLKRQGKNVTTDNNGMVVRMTIPCSAIFAPCEKDLHSGDRYLDILKDVVAYPTMYKIVVAVSTDDTGDDIYRQELSDSRATAIVDYLAAYARNNEINIVAVGLSDEYPVAPNNTIANRERNRRVDIYIVPAEKMIEMAKAGTLVKKGKR